jgi:hypothetical protein
LVSDAYRPYLWAVSRSGIVICIDISTSSILQQTQLPSSIGTLFTAVRSMEASGGILAIAATGEVIRLKLGEFANLGVIHMILPLPLHPLYSQFIVFIGIEEYW